MEGEVSDAPLDHEVAALHRDAAAWTRVTLDVQQSAAQPTPPPTSFTTSRERPTDWISMRADHPREAGEAMIAHIRQGLTLQLSALAE